MTDLGKSLRAARQAARTSLSAMATKTHYSKPYLSQLETGIRAVKREHVTAYEQALGVEIRGVTDRISAEDVALIAQSTDALTVLGLRHGGNAVAGMAEAQWGLAADLLGRSIDDAVRPRLLAESVRLADRFAWSVGETGNVARAGRIYRSTLELAEEDPGGRCMVMTNFAHHLMDRGRLHDALDVLTDVVPVTPTHEFRLQGARALAYARMGQWERTVRHVNLADEAHTRVDLAALPTTHLPYASGYDGHAHRDAGKAYHALTRAGVRKAASAAVDRLELAVNAFGPDRLKAIEGCRQRLVDLAG